MGVIDLVYNEKTINKENIFKGKVISLNLHTVELPNGKESTREVINHPGGVAVVAFKDKDTILIVEQFRKPIEMSLLELPAGKLEYGENPEVCGIRELEEETGLTGEADVIFLWHFLVMDKDSGLKEDKYMFVCRFINPEGKLVENSIEGEYCWVTESNVETWLKKPFVDKEEILSLVEKAKTVKKPIMMTEERLQGDNF